MGLSLSKAFSNFNCNRFFKWVCNILIKTKTIPKAFFKKATIISWLGDNYMSYMDLSFTVFAKLNTCMFVYFSLYKISNQTFYFLLKGMQNLKETSDTKSNNNKAIAIFFFLLIVLFLPHTEEWKIYIVSYLDLHNCIWSSHFPIYTHRCVKTGFILWLWTLKTV